MDRFQRILVCIGRPEYRQRMLEYAGGRSKLAKIKEVHILYVAEPVEAGAEPGEPSEELTSEALEALVNEHFKGHGDEKFVLEGVRGSPLIEPLRYAHDKEIDLIILGRHYGRKDDAPDDALLARRITRKATCSVLVLPDNYQITANAILVPVRDSDCSAAALETACDIAALTKAPVTALDVFYVGTGYSRVGTSLEEHQVLLEAAARRECERLIKRTDTHGVDVACECLPDLEGGPVPIIHEEIEKLSARLVVIGARGRTGAAGVLLGNVTEQLIQKSPVPVLAVKKKGECIGILRALLTLA